MNSRSTWSTLCSVAAATIGACLVVFGAGTARAQGKSLDNFNGKARTSKPQNLSTNAVSMNATTGTVRDTNESVVSSRPLAIASAPELAMRERRSVDRVNASRNVRIWEGAVTDRSSRSSLTERARKRVEARYSVLAYDQQRAPESVLEPEFEQFEPAPETAKFAPVPIWERELDRATADVGFYHADLIRRVGPAENARSGAIARVTSKLAARHLRRIFRRDLNDRRDENLSMTEFDYLDERARISRIGRPQTAAPDFLADRRSEFLDDQDIDEDINLLEWGPIVLNDRGQLGLDIDRIRRGGELAGSRLQVAQDSDDPEEARGESLFQDRTVRVDTDLRFSPRVQDISSGARQALGRVRASIEVDFYDSIFQRRFMSMELETRLDPDGDHALFLNFTLLEN